MVHHIHHVPILCNQLALTAFWLGPKMVRMKPLFREPAKCSSSGSEIRLGIASWDDGDESEDSAKYTWFDKNNHAARGGEVPVEALPQMLDFAIRKGYIRPNSGLLRGLKKRLSANGYKKERVR